MGERVDVELEVLPDRGAGRLFRLLARDLCWQPCIRDRVTGREAEEFLTATRPRVLPALLRAAGRVRHRGDLRPPLRSSSRARPSTSCATPAAANCCASRPRATSEQSRQGAVAPSWPGIEATLGGRDRRRAAPVPPGGGDAGQRAPTRSAARAIDAVRIEAVTEQLNPLLLEAFERTRSLVRELGWPSVGDDRGAVGHRPGPPGRADRGASWRPARTRSRPSSSRALRDEIGIGFDELRTRRPARLLPRALTRRLIPGGRAARQPRADARRAWARFRLPRQGASSTRRRVRTSHRARSARPVRVPDEVYLVIPRVGGRDDYEALMHEAGHAQHYAHVDRVAPVRAPLPRRQLRHRGLRVPLPAPDRGPRAG